MNSESGVKVFYVRALDHETFYVDSLDEVKRLGRGVIEAVGVIEDEDDDYIYLVWMWKRDEVDGYEDKIQVRGIRILKKCILERRELAALRPYLNRRA